MPIAKKPEDLLVLGLLMQIAFVDRRSLLLRGGVALGHGLPIDDVEERADIIRPTVLIVQVVSVFPHVEA